MNNTIPNLE